MLPSTVFAAACGTYEISAAEIYSDGFSFRVPETRRADFVCCSEAFEITLYGIKERAYRSIRVSAYTLSETEPGLFRFSSDDSVFRKEFSKLLREYARYINDRDSTEERGGAYSGSAEEWLQKMTGGAVFPPDGILPCETAHVLNEPSKWNAPRESLRGADTAYIGSNLCPRLFPGDGTLERLTQYCAGEGIKPVVCFPPMPERETENYLRRADRLPAGCEIEINDIGTALMLKDRGFEMTAGPFLNRRAKDPRREACGYSNASGTEFYTEYLKGMGISRFSYEAGGKPDIILPGSVLYLPLYITNTSLLCPLAAAVRGDRGAQIYESECAMPCADKAFFYPDNLRLIGRFNSLLGFADETLDAERINEYIRRGITRLAVNL